MEKKMTKIEKEIVERILSEYSKKYPKLVHQIPYLVVKSRELTGVGMYVGFVLKKEGELYLEEKLKDGVLGTNDIIKISSLKIGLGFVLYITKGRIDLLELFTYLDETWDGKYPDFKIERIEGEPLPKL